MILPQKQKLTYYAAFFCLRYNGFKFITVNFRLENFGKTFGIFCWFLFWNTLTRFMFMYVCIFESFLTVSTTFRICPCVFCKTRKGNRKKTCHFRLVCCPKNKMFVIVLFGLILPSTGRSQLSLPLPAFFCFSLKMGCVCMFFALFCSINNDIFFGFYFSFLCFIASLFVLFCFCFLFSSLFVALRCVFCAPPTHVTRAP